MLIFGFLRANSQSLSIFDVDTSNFPIMKAKFFAIDKDGKQILNQSLSDFEILENEQQRVITNIICPAPKPIEKVSIAMSIDISGSMSGIIDLAKQTANDLCNMIGMPPIGVCITNL